MSVLVVGISHRSAPVELLERVVLGSDDAIKLSHQVLEIDSVTESVVVSTCNRLEVFAETDRFHGSVEEIARLIAERAGLELESLLQQVYVHFDQSAVAHLFRVASGLDSMVVGESQILGQIREALQRAQQESTAGASLNSLFQQALRVGKRGHAETDIDRSAPSLVTAAFEAAGPVITAEGTRFLVAGAGTMSALAVRTLIDRGIEPAQIWVANRTFERGIALVAGYGVGAVRWESLDVELAAADVLVTCTGSAEVVFEAARIAEAVAGGRSLTVIDLALPRDVAHEVRDLASVQVVDLEVLGESALGESALHGSAAEDVQQVREIVDAEVRAFLSARSQAKVTPTVVALRSMATEVVGREIDRLETRLVGLAEGQLGEIRAALHRVAEKLIHQPTVRVKDSGDEPENLTYADALAHLFRLDPAAVSAVTDVPTVGGGEQ
ncbi:MAG TPA: glutamyl-tRNA reductase [Aeromicrobium sp.]|nr:glutamyl-tRNA reductase [Aeromicrobium sp.]